MSNKYNIIQDVFHGVNISKSNFNFQSEKIWNEKKYSILVMAINGYTVEWYMNSNDLSSLLITIKILMNFIS